MAEEGIGVDVAGGGELALALRGGVDASRCILHGNAKTDAEIAAAHEAGVGLIVVDNLDDLDRRERIATREQGVLVRITPGVEGATHAAISTGGLDAKFGLPIDQAAVILGRVQERTTVTPYNRAMTCRENASAKRHFSSLPVANINSCKPWRSSSCICPMSSSAVPTRHVARISSASGETRANPRS